MILLSLNYIIGQTGIFKFCYNAGRIKKIINHKVDLLYAMYVICMFSMHVFTPWSMGFGKYISSL